MASETFILMGLIIFLGFAAQLLFERTKVPDVLVLMLFGILVGPFNAIGLIVGTEVVPVQLFAELAPVIGTIALIIILFEGGFNLNLFKVMTELSTATWFTLLVFSATTIFSALVMILFGWPFLHGLLLGAVIGGTSSAIVITLLSRSSASQETKILLSLESALTDALCVVATVVIVKILTESSVSLSSTANSILGQFSIAAMIAIIISVVWIKVLLKFKDIPFSYMLSIAVMFLLYGAVEFVGGSGVISVLVFGLILGNWNPLSSAFNLGGEITEFDKIFRSFQSEVTFFVRTFFFVYLGVVFNVRNLSQNLHVLVPIGAVLLTLGIARFAATKVLIYFKQAFAANSALIFSMMPRGLAAAVLATYPAANGIQIPFFSEMVFLTILLTNITTAAGFYRSENSGKSKNGSDSAGNPGAGSKKPRIVQQK